MEDVVFFCHFCWCNSFKCRFLIVVSRRKTPVRMSVYFCLLIICNWMFLFVLDRRRTTVKMLCIYADYKSDESYTPSKISVRVGNNFHNLQEIRVTTLCDIIVCPHLKARTDTAAWGLLQSFIPTQIICFSFRLFLSAAVRDGGAQWLDSHLSDESGETLTSLFHFKNGP